MTPEDAFLSKIKKTEEGCWEWQRGKDQRGYGIFWDSQARKHVRAHRWAYEHWNGPLGDRQVDHLCQVKCCVNPEHLDRVTQEDHTEREMWRYDVVRT